MFRILKSFCVAAILGGIFPSAHAFSLLGPFPSGNDAPDGFQQEVIGYNLAGDIGGVKNLGEEYRWNTPILNYAFDANFFDYFGSNGVVAVEQAITILNAVSNLSSYSASMNEVPLEATRFNYQAQALRLRDLKSVALGFMVEELGLAQPDRYVWTLRDRRVNGAGPCPNMLYDVIKRNFDPATFEPTSYVNGTLYSYRITEICNGPPNTLANAVEFPVDPLAPTFTSVASRVSAALHGGFYTGLTRDDLGGFRYMLRTNNINFESVSTDSVLLQTNATVSQLLTTSDLSLLVAQSLTNNAAALIALFPGLEISSTTQFFTNATTTNVTATSVNDPNAPFGTPPQLVLTTNLTTNVVARFIHNFANVVTNSFFTNQLVSVQNTTVRFDPYAPFGTGALVTNVSQTTTLVPVVGGDFFLITSNACMPQIISTQLISVVATTNVTLVSTNATGDGQSFSQSTVTYFTNRIFEIYPCDRITGSVGLRRGMDRFTFVRQNYDSLLGRFFQPVTNRYTLKGITNSTEISQVFERVITGPDFLFTAEERMAPDQAWLSAGFRTEPTRGNGYVVANILAPDAVDGPGTREPFVSIEFNKVGPLLRNTYAGPGSVSEATALTNFVWGSYDGSTNAPIIYPSGSSIADLENQILIQVNPAVLPNGTQGIFYNSTFTVTGGQPPYSFALAPGSAGLPSGLTLSAAGVISGTSSSSGTFDVVVRISDSGARVVDRPYTLIINP